MSIFDLFDLFLVIFDKTCFLMFLLLIRHTVLFLLYMYFTRYLDRIIRREQLQEFELRLMEHQKAKTVDGNIQFIIA